MLNKKIKSLKAKNILCFGPEGIQINFEELGPIIIVQGRNLDFLKKGGDPKDYSNGSGKSSLADVISFVLYGQTVKKPKEITQDNIVHNGQDKTGLYGEIIIDNYKIVRTKKGSKSMTLNLFEYNNEAWIDTTKGKGIKVVQKDIIDKVVGMNYETFVNTFVFADDDKTSFLECDAEAKRNIVDNLLCLEKYREYHQNAKDWVKFYNQKLKDLNRDYEKTCITFDNFLKREKDIRNQIDKWFESKNKNVFILETEIGEVQASLDNSEEGYDIKRYEEAQNEINLIKTKLDKFRSRKEQILGVMKDGVNKIEMFENTILELKSTVRKIDNEIAKKNERAKDCQSILDRVGDTCPTCNGIIKAENIESTLSQAKKDLFSLSEELKELEPKLEQKKKSLQHNETTLGTMRTAYKQAQAAAHTTSDEIDSCEKKLIDLGKIPNPETGGLTVVLRERLALKVKTLENLKEEIKNGSPYDSLLESHLKDMEVYREDKEKLSKEIASVQEEIPYYNYWVKGFGDSGIRKYIIESIMPILNSRIAYWLHYLVDGRIRMTFDSNLNETIDVFPFDGKAYAYSGISNGMRRRLMLAMRPAFGHVMAMKSGCNLSCIFLDEVSMNMDQFGVECIFRMIKELSKEKQVFVIDHNSNLTSMLENYPVLKLERKNGITQLVDSFSENS